MALRGIDGGTNYYAQFTNHLPTDPNFFPIGVWFESILSQSDIDLDKAAGLNTYVVLTGNSDLSLLQPNNMYAILQQSEWSTSQTAINNPNVVGWELYDEIDMQQGPVQGPITLTNIMNSLPDDGRMTFNNYGKGVIFWETDTEAARFVNDFQDVTSADIYWFTDPNVSSFAEGGRFLTGQDINLTEAQTDLAANYGYVVDRMRYLDGLDGDRQPIWAFVEVGWPFTETAAQGGEQIAPDEIQAAVMHSLIAGAQGIIYFNHSFGGPEQTQHALRDPRYAEERAAVTEINGLITQLAPVLNSPFDDGYASVTPGVRLMSKYYAAEDDHYVFAGSTQHSTQTATFTLAGANPDMDGVVVVVNEGRTITVTDGVWTDMFADGNAWHVYQVELGVVQPPPPPTIINGTNKHDTLRGTAGVDTISGLGGQDQIDGAAGNDLIHGNGGKDFIDGGAGADVLWGDAGADQFIFKAGEANGDSVMDFVGNGARTGDLLMFIGFGDAQDGASFTRLDASHYQIHSAVDGHNEIISLGATVSPTDFLFI